MEKVSVIVPVHNAELYIASTLESLRSQTYRNIEILVINGGSTDNSMAIVKELNIPNLTVYNRANLGQASNSNFGIQKSTGNLIKFLDADDILSDDCIEKMVIKWQENKKRLVFGEWHYFVDYIENINYNHSPIYKDYNDVLDYYVDIHKLAGSMLAVWMWLIPREILDRAGGWDERLTITNDLEFSTKLLMESDGVGFAKGAIHYYRKGITSAMTSKMTINLPERTATSVYIGLNKTSDYVLKIDNSKRIALVFANLYQKWVYMFYPNYKSYVLEFETKIQELGGSDHQPPGGALFKLLSSLLTWKIARRLQILLYKSIWKPVLRYKHKLKMKKQFGIE